MCRVRKNTGIRGKLNKCCMTDSFESVRKSGRRQDFKMLANSKRVEDQISFFPVAVFKLRQNECVTVTSARWEKVIP